MQEQKIAPDTDTVVTIFEGCNITGGTPVAGFNNDRDSSNVAVLQPLAAPTIVNEGGDYTLDSKNWWWKRACWSCTRIKL